MANNKLMASSTLIAIGPATTSPATTSPVNTSPAYKCTANQNIHTGARFPQYFRQQAFTLIELVVVIAIAAILLTLAVPPYQDFIKRNGVESLQSRFAAAVVTARTEAASRNTITSLCASADGATCGGVDDWTKGWIVFVDATGTGTFVAGEEVLLSFQTSSTYKVRLQSETATSPSTGKLALISFTNQGFTHNSARAFATICEPKNDNKYAKGLTIERSGRVMKSRDSGTDKIDDFRFDTGTSTAGQAVNLNCAES